MKKVINMYKYYVKISSIGIELCLTILISLVLGYFIDKYFLISPIGIIIGLIVGIIGSIKIIYICIKKYKD